MKSFLLIAIGINVFLIAPALSQTVPDPQAAPVLPQAPVNPQIAEPEVNTIPSRSVQLTLSDVVTLLLQNNRQLRNAALNRIVQREQLRDAESAFAPRFEPILGLGMSRSFSNLPLANSDPVSETAQIEGQMRTPLGTAITVTLTPLESRRLGITVTQPLLRGAGQRINEIPIERARQNEIRNVLNFRQSLTDRITDATIAYRAIARAQETLKIQQLAIETQRQQLQFIEVLVNADRRPRSELTDLAANITAAEAQLITAQNQLQQAKSNLLNLLDLEESIDPVVPEALIDEFRNGEITAESVAQLRLEDLLQKAYANRVDYELAQLDIDSAQLDQILAQDNQRWNLNLQIGANLGDTSDASAQLRLSRVFGDRSVNTAVTQANIGIQQQQNNFVEVTEAIRQAVEDSLRNVISTSELITATRQAREAAERRLEVATVRFRRGRGVDIFQILSLQNDVVTAQNNEVNAKIDFLDSLARLDQTIGVTLENWNVQVEASELLNL